MANLLGRGVSGFLACDQYFEFLEPDSECSCSLRDPWAILNAEETGEVTILKILENPF